MLVPSGSPFETMLPEIKIQIGISCTFPDLNRLALTSKIGKLCADIIFDIVANEIECKGQTREERKSDLAKLYKEISPHFMRSLFADIDKLKDKVFENEKLIIEYEEESYTPYYLLNFALKKPREAPFGYEEIIHSGIMPHGDTGIKIHQTSSNHVSNVISTKLLEALKKASVLYFKKLCSGITISDLYKSSGSDLQLIKNRCSVDIYDWDRSRLGLGDFHYIIGRLLEETGFLNKVDCFGHSCIHGKREDIQKFITILNAQQFPDVTPTLATLKQARGLPV